MSRQKKLLSVALILLVAMGAGTALASGAQEGGGADAEQEPVTLRLAHISDEQHPSHKGSVAFKEEVEERTDGRITVEIYSNSQLGSAPEYTEQVKLGTLALGLATSGQLQVWIPEYGAVMIPFLFESYDHAHRALDGEAGELLADMAREEDFEVLANWEWGFRQLSNSRMPVRTPNDVSQLKMRVPNEIQLQAMYKTLGASTSIIAFPELYQALAQGVVDGQCNPIATIYYQNLYEVQDYVTMLYHVYNTQMLVMSSEVYDSLSAEDQTILKEAAMNAGKMVRELTVSSEQDLIDTMKDEGIQFNSPDLSPFREAVAPAIDEIADFTGADFTERFVGLVEEAR